MHSDNIWLDPLYLDDLLNEEEKNIRKSAHDFCEKNLLPIVVKNNSNTVYNNSRILLGYTHH